MNEQKFYEMFKNEFIEKVSQELSEKYKVGKSEVQEIVKDAYFYWIESTSKQELNKARKIALNSVINYYTMIFYPEMKDIIEKYKQELTEEEKEEVQQQVVEKLNIKPNTIVKSNLELDTFIDYNELYNVYCKMMSTMLKNKLQNVKEKAEFQIAYNVIATNLTKEQLDLLEEYGILDDDYLELELAKKIAEGKIDSFFENWIKEIQNELNDLEKKLKEAENQQKLLAFMINNYQKRKEQLNIVIKHLTELQQKISQVKTPFVNVIVK